MLQHLIKNDREIFKEEELPKWFTTSQTEWQNFADKHKGMIVAKFGMKPCSLRVDQIDRDVSGQDDDDGGILLKKLNFLYKKTFILFFLQKTNNPKMKEFLTLFWSILVFDLLNYLMLEIQVINEHGVVM